MKRAILFCAVLALFASSARTQGVGIGVQGDLVNFNLGIAQTKLTIPNLNATVDYSAILKNVYGLGYGGGVHFDVNFVLLSFRLSGDYIMLSPDKQKYQSQFGVPGITIDGGRIDIYSANANLKLVVLPLPVIHVYLTGGAGVVRLNTHDATLSYNGFKIFTLPAFQSQTEPTVNAGAGVDLQLGPIALFAELKVNFIMTQGKTSSEVPLATAGITF